MISSAGASSSSKIEPKFGESVPWPGLETDPEKWPEIGSSWADGLGEQQRLFTRSGSKTLRIVYQKKRYEQDGTKLVILPDEFAQNQKKLASPRSTYGLPASTAATAPVTPKRGVAPRRTQPKGTASTRRQSADKIEKAKKDFKESVRKTNRSTNMRDPAFKRSASNL